LGRLGSTDVLSNELFDLAFQEKALLHSFLDGGHHADFALLLLMIASLDMGWLLCWLDLRERPKQLKS
jgi:hypothetical protein